MRCWERERIRNGLACRWKVGIRGMSRADLPDGPFPELSDPLAVERSRVLTFSGELTTDAKLLVGDERVPPSHVVAVTTIPARVIGTARQPWQRLVSNIRDNLLMKSLDPG